MKTTIKQLVSAAILVSGLSSYAQTPAMVKDIKPGKQAPNHYGELKPVFNLNGVLCFKADDGTESYAHDGLWKTDGSEAGTVFIDKNIPESEIYAINENLYFLYRGELLSYTDKKNEGKKDETARDDKSEKRKETAKKFGKALFGNVTGSQPAPNTAKKQDDGTVGNYIRIKSPPKGYRFMETTLRMKNDTLYFWMEGNGQAELYKSDGTEKGTVSTKVASKLFYKDYSKKDDVFFPCNNLFYFRGKTDQYGIELFSTDATPKGTFLFDVNREYTSTGDNWSSWPKDFTDVNGTLYFTATDGKHGGKSMGGGYIDGYGLALWKSNGTAEGTQLVWGYYKNGDYANVSNLINVNGTLYFSVGYLSVASRPNEAELWKTNGTSEGTVLVKKIVKATSINSLTNVNGRLYFITHIMDNGGTLSQHDELWTSNGTEVSTTKVTSAKITTPDNLTNVNGVLYFTADDGIHGNELWKSDGSAAGTVMVQDIKPFDNFGSEPNKLVNVNGVLYFTADDGPHGRELWKLDTNKK